MQITLIVIAAAAALGVAGLGARRARRWWAARPPRATVRATNDRLRWWEEIPLALALLAQSYVVGLWYFASIAGAAWQVDLVVAIAAGLALDLIVVTTVMGRRAGRSSGWSWATSLGAFGCSALIALDRYGWEWRSGLHIAFPLVVFLYSQHLATARESALASAPERLDASEAPRAVPHSRPAPQALFQALPLPALVAEPAERLTLLAELFEPQAQPSAPSDPALEATSERLEATSETLEPQAQPSAPPSASAHVLEVPVFESLDDLKQNLLARMAAAEHPGVPLSKITVVETPRYACPHCGAALRSKQSRGAAVSNGYCPTCKGRR